jgi:hypothetical protein
VFIISLPKSKNIPLPADVEAAINSIEPVPVVITENINTNYHKITLGDWSSIDIKCAFPKRDRYINRNNLKGNVTVFKRARD